MVLVINTTSFFSSNVLLFVATLIHESWWRNDDTYAGLSMEKKSNLGTKNKSYIYIIYPFLFYFIPLRNPTPLSGKKNVGAARCGHWPKQTTKGWCKILDAFSAKRVRKHTSHHAHNFNNFWHQWIFMVHNFLF